MTPLKWMSVHFLVSVLIFRWLDQVEQYTGSSDENSIQYLLIGNKRVDSLSVDVLLTVRI